MTDTYSLPIGPHRFTVVSSPQVTKQLLSDGKYGETDLDSLTISIRGDLPDTLWRETLTHETLHAIMATTGLNLRLGEHLEEDIVATLSPLLTQAMLAGDLK